jgi:hypothetical protein
MPETTPNPEIEVHLDPDELAVVRTALKMLLATLGREEAGELALVQSLLEKLDQR